MEVPGREITIDDISILSSMIYHVMNERRKGTLTTSSSSDIFNYPSLLLSKGTISDEAKPYLIRLISRLRFL